MQVLQFPLTKITISFVLGILFAYFIHLGVNNVYLIILLAGIILVGHHLLVSRKNSNLFSTMIFYIIAFAIGINTLLIHNDRNDNTNFTQHIVADKPQEFVITLREKIKSTATNERYIALVNQIDRTKCSGRIILNIRKSALHINSFIIGNILKVKGNLNTNISKNPNEFDYKKYLENKQIFGQLYTDAVDIRISPVIKKDVWHYTSKIRTTIIQNLNENHFNPTELNVAIALILGQQQDIDSEIIKDYQYAGVVHILSVSGLHIGLVLLFVSFILKPLPNTTNWSFVKLAIILTSLALFGILAGLAPSVIRSVTMFSFVAIGNHFKRSTNIYHTLLVSILLILLAQPYFLFDVGFQLSYLALFFILWLHPILSKIWRPKNKVATYIWTTLTVSFAAQIGTLPLSLYYFHQFPGLFFVANIIVIPIVGVIMGVGAIVMIASLANSCPLFLSKSLEWSIFILNKIINRIASFDSFVIKNVSFNSTFLLICCYIGLFSFILWIEKRRFYNLIIVFLIIIVSQTFSILSLWKDNFQKEWIVFYSKKSPLIAKRDGLKITLFTKENIHTNDALIKTINAYLAVNPSCQLTKIELLKNTAYFNGNKILIIDHLGIYPKKDVAVVVLTESPKINLERLIKHSAPERIIADASTPRYLQNLWKMTCLKHKIPFHNISEKGFFKLLN